MTLLFFAKNNPCDGTGLFFLHKWIFSTYRNWWGKGRLGNW